MPSTAENGSRNLILAALPPEEMQLFSREGQKLVVHEGKTLQHAGLASDWLFFPTTAVLSLLAGTGEGLTVETGLVGREGMVGLRQFQGHAAPSLDCVVQRGGELCQIAASPVRRANLTKLETLLLRYANYRVTELAQAAVCNKFHLVRQRFCRWLLTAQDRIGKHEMEFTQETLASMVGARRPVVASLIGILEDEGLIDYRRECITILDRTGLERSACECYGILSTALADYRHTLKEDP